MPLQPEPKKILIIKLRYIGDVLLASSIFRPLRDAWPRATISMLANSDTTEIIRQNPYLDQILSPPRSGWSDQYRFLREIRTHHFDCVIDLTDGDRSAFITALTGARTRVGFDNEGRMRRLAYTTCIRAKYGTMHMVDYHGLALKALDIETPPESPEVFLTTGQEHRAEQLMKQFDLDQKPLIVLHPSARYWFKAWPPDRFAAIGDWLHDQGYVPVLVGAERDSTLGKTIQKFARHPIVSLMGRTSILELAALLKRGSLFVGNDGGPMHIAAAVGCPVLALFGPSDPAVWGPRGKGPIRVMFKGLDCRKCFHPGCFRGEQNCMKQITVEEVLQTAKELLNQSLNQGRGDDIIRD